MSNFNIKYKVDNIFVDLARDSELPLHGFNSNFSAVNSVSGGKKSVMLRLENLAFPETNEFFVLKLDFSEAFSNNFSLGSSYDSSSADSPRRGVRLRIGVGAVNQPLIKDYREITTDYFASSGTGIIGILFSKNEQILRDFAQREGSGKFLLTNNYPGQGSFVPIEVILELIPDELRKIEQKPVSVKVPENFPAFVQNLATLQQKIFSSALSQDYGDKIRAFVTSNLGGPFNRDLYTTFGNTVTVPFYVLSMQYFALYNYKYEDFQFKAVNHPFDLVLDSNSSASLPASMSADASDALWSSENINYSRGPARELWKIMWELLGYAKYTHSLYLSAFSGVGSSLSISTTRLESYLNALLTNIVNIREFSNYTTYSGAQVSRAKELSFNFLVRTLLNYVDFIKKHGLGNPSYSNIGSYENLDLHTELRNLDNSAKYAFPILGGLSTNELAEDSNYLSAMFAVYDFFRFVSLSTEFLSSQYADDAEADFESMKAPIKELIERVNSSFHLARYFDANVPTSDPSSVMLDIEKYPSVALLAAYIDQFYGSENTSTVQPWHFINKYYRAKSIGTNTLRMLMKTTTYLSADLADNTTFTESEFLTILGDTDIINTMVFSLIDCVYQKQTSTTLSLKLHLTNY